jgi:hypothetical protein
MNKINSNSLEIVRNDNTVRSGSNGVEGDGIVYGYAAGYDGPLNPMFPEVPGSGGRALPGAFKNLDPSDLALVWMMQQAEPIGKILSIYEEPGKGLYYKAKLILDVQRAREVYALLRFGVYMHSAVLYMESRSVLNHDLTVEEGIKVFSSLWVMLLTLSSTPLALADPITTIYYNE